MMAQSAVMVAQMIESDKQVTAFSSADQAVPNAVEWLRTGDHLSADKSGAWFYYETPGTETVKSGQ
jgi:hypothetical protein